MSYTLFKCNNLTGTKARKSEILRICSKQNEAEFQLIITDITTNSAFEICIKA